MISSWRLQRTDNNRHNPAKWFQGANNRGVQSWYHGLGEDDFAEDDDDKKDEWCDSEWEWHSSCWWELAGNNYSCVVVSGVVFDQVTDLVDVFIAIRTWGVADGVVEGDITLWAAS